MTSISETETVIKRIVPYLIRRGYDLDKDLTFEYPAKGSTRATMGFVDITVKRSNKIAFIIEAKKIAKTLSSKDRTQAVGYGRDCKVPFVVLTNGVQFECINVYNEKRIRWNGKLYDKVPSFSELPLALSLLKKDQSATEIFISKDTSLPFRPGLPLKQLNSLFSRCHNTIRKIEKNEDHAFSDFFKDNVFEAFGRKS